jgi:hypothetical protein
MRIHLVDREDLSIEKVVFGVRAPDAAKKTRWASEIRRPRTGPTVYV